MSKQELVADAATIAELAKEMFTARAEARAAKGSPKGLAKAKAERLHAKLVALMVRGVREYAAGREESGWNVTVEALPDAEIAELITNAESLSGAVRRVYRVVEVKHLERRAVAEAEAAAAAEAEEEAERSSDAAFAELDAAADAA